MAGKFQPYDSESQSRSSRGSASSVPAPQDGTPVSFRKNVNRAKTKRWMEAKQYSYDGDDWGEDEYDEYDGNPPPVPQPPSLSKANGGASGVSSRHSSRPSPLSADPSRSTDQVAAIDPNRSRRSADSDETKASHGASDSKPLPFVRPADIYKRMRQEAADHQGQSQGVGRPDEASQEVGQSARDPASSVSPLSSFGGVADDDDRALHQPLNPIIGAKPGNEESRSSNSKTGDTPAIGLPEVKRLSNFGAGVFGELGPSASATTSTDPQHPPLQQNNSRDLQTAVRQAFDEPETPSSTIDSVARSNSDSTSVVSPIIEHRTVSDQPTIVEEPGESESTPVDTPRNVPFTLGHRRDVSVTSSENSLSRKPEISEGGQHPKSATAEMSSTDPPQDYFQLYPSTAEPPESSRHFPSRGDEAPSPLRPGSGAPAEQNDSKEPMSVIVPSMNSNSSPGDTENDRLSKEIIRSLSRENSPADGTEEFRAETGHGDGVNANQPENYRNDEAGQRASGPPKPEAQPQASGPPNTFDEVLSGDPHSTPAPATEQPKPRLARRFSWESSSSEELTPAGDIQHAPSQTAAYHGQPRQLGSESMATDPGNVSEGDALGDRSSMEKPELTVIPPSTVDEHSMSDRDLAKGFDGEDGPNVSPLEHDDSAVQALVPVSAPPPSAEPSLLGFRDILGIKSSGERVRSFNRTRDQFAALDTGLNYWIRVTVNAHPEHMDTVEESLKLAGSAPKPSVVSKAKFPKLPSLGNLATSGPSGNLHARRSSAHMMNRQQVEQRGKDLLHSAGVLGGRAGGAAKGFFAKGKNRLNRGGADKGAQSSRRSVHLPEDPSAAELQRPSSRKQTRSISIGRLSLWSATNAEDTFRGPASKQERMAPDVPGNRPLDTRSMHSTAVGEPEAQKDEQRATSQAQFTTPEALSTSTNERQPPSSPTGAIPDTGVRENPGDIRSFERELVTALRLDDVDLQSQELANSEFSSKASFRPNASMAGNKGATRDSVADSAVRSTEDAPTVQADDGAHVEPSVLKNLDTHDLLAESHLLHSHSNEPGDPRSLTINDEMSQPSYEPGPDSQGMLHENAGVGRMSTPRSLAHSSNATPTKSPSHVSDIDVVVASKAVRADQIRVVDSGSRKDPGGNSESTADTYGKEGTKRVDSVSSALSLEHPGDASASLNFPRSGDLGTLSTREPETSGVQISSFGRSVSTSRDYDPDNPNTQHHQPSVSSLATQEASPMPAPQQPQPDRLRNETSRPKSRSNLLSSLSQLASDGFRNLDNMRAKPAVRGNDTTPLTARSSTEYQAPKNPSAMDRLKNISGLRRTSLGAAGGPRKNAMNRLSGMFGRRGNKSEISPSFESFGDRQNQTGAHKQSAPRRSSMPIQSTAPFRSQDLPKKSYDASSFLQYRNQKPLPPSPGELSSDAAPNPRMPPSQPAPESQGGPKSIINTESPDTADQKPGIQRKSATSKPLPLTPEDPGTSLQEGSSAPPPDPANTNHPHGGEGRVVTETQSPFELPVRREDSSEEVIMTGTAYPGQEWRPARFG